MFIFYFTNSQNEILMFLISFILAWLIDSLWGEFPNSFHPVAWLGKYLKLWENIFNKYFYDKLSNSQTFILGGLMWITTAVLILTASVLIQFWLFSLPSFFEILILCLLIKPTFAWNMLGSEVLKIGATDSLVQSQNQLSTLVSRDVTTLTQTQVYESGIETLAENFNDSLISPLLFLIVFGLPGAMLYRFANTADAMFGYRGKFEYFGKVSAVADDILSFVGARVSAWALNNYSFKNFYIINNEALKTPSPNGGLPMATMAFNLHTTLSKPQVYTLFPEFNLATKSDINSAYTLANKAAQTFVFFTCLTLALFCSLGS